TGKITYTSGGTAYDVDVVSGKVTSGVDQVYVGGADGKLLVGTAGATNTTVAAGAENETSKAFAMAAAVGGAGQKTFTLGGVSWSGKADDANGNGTYVGKHEGKTITVTVSGATNGTTGA